MGDGDMRRADTSHVSVTLSRGTITISLNLRCSQIVTRRPLIHDPMNLVSIDLYKM